MWKIDHRPYRLPFRATVRTAHGPWAVREGVIVRVVRIDEGGRETGAAGWGEIAPIPWFGSENAEEAVRALEGFGGKVADEAAAIVGVPERCGATRAGLAAAFADAARQAADAPTGSAPAVEFLSLAALLPAGREAISVAPRRLEAGFRTFKWKVGVLPAVDELAMLDDLLGEMPDGARLRLDANGGWDRRTAERWLAAAAERPAVEYVEQPVDCAERGGEDLLRGLAEDYPVTLALDEALGGAADVDRWLAHGWSGVWVIKPALIGDPFPVLERLAKARAEVVFGSALETAVGAVAGLRLAFDWAAREARPVAVRRALGYGVWPLFAKPEADAPWTTPFVRRADLARINPEALWSAIN